MQHLIKKQEFLLRLMPGLEPFSVQHTASSYYRERLSSVLERVFDELSTEEEVILIDRLVIDIGRISEKNLRDMTTDEELYATIKRELLRALRGERPEVGLRRADLRTNALSQWWYYMEKGRLPWNIQETGDEWYQRVLELLSVDYGSVTRLREALEHQSVFLQRVTHQHPDEFLEILTGILTGIRQPLLAQRVEDVCFLSERLENSFHDMTAVIGGQPGPAEKRALVIRGLRRWLETHSLFLALPKTERKAAVWRVLLREAAMRPAKIRREGAESVLFREFLYPENTAIHALLRESGLDLRTSWFDGKDVVGGHAEPGERLAESRSAGSRGIDRPEKEKTGKIIGKIGDGRIGDRKLSDGSDSDGKGIDGDSAPANVVGLGKEDRPIGTIEKNEIIGTLKEDHHLIDEEGLPGSDEGLLGRHAGLILLHPFLSTFFSRCKIWENGAFFGSQARQQAVFLLHFLATEKKEASEYELLFPKLFCGYGLEEPLPARIAIPDSAYEEGDALLQNILLQWGKLKNTSIGGLREGFLQRTGKLVRRDERMQLMLEISAIDVLLDFLPWGLSVVKFPWLKEIVHVEWR